METLTKARVKEVSEKIQTFLDKLSEEEGIKMTMNGGNYTHDSFTLKIKGLLLTDSGAAFVSDSSHATADAAARRDGIAYTAPHIIGSVWRFRSSGLVKVVEYSPRNRRYPWICQVYETGTRIKANRSSFAGTEVRFPTEPYFYIWFTNDADSDTITQANEEICDNVNDFVSVKYADSNLIDDFYDLCGKYYESVAGNDEHADRVLSAKLYGLIILQDDLEKAIITLKSSF